MNMTYQELSSTPEFANLHPVKQQILKELIEHNQHISPESMLPKLVTINKELNKRNLNFTKEETQLLIQVMKSNMSPAEQQKVDMLTSMFK